MPNFGNIIKKVIKLTKEQGFVAAFKTVKNKIIKKFRLQDKFGYETAETIAFAIQHNIRPMYTIAIERKRKRLNIVTDSINNDSLFGGVATALVIGSELAIKNDMDLRIITRTAHINPMAYFNFVKANEIQHPKNVEFYSDFDKIKDLNLLKLEVSENDIFMATSWWTAHVTGLISGVKRFFYLIQESELMFYPNGDERLLCENVLKKTNIDFIVNSKYLYDHFAEVKMDNIIKNGCFFEPSFPEHIFKAGEQSFAPKQKYKMFFYGRPNNPRNLYRTGLKFINDAVTAGIIDMDIWDIVIAGSDNELFVFSNGRKPLIKGRMTWKEYSAFASTVDLAICLMYTPHPSYPPFDMAASGAVVLTNKYMNKQSMECSENIILSELDQKAMLEGFAKAISLAMDSQKREMNYKNSRINRSWNETLKPVNKFVSERIR